MENDIMTAKTCATCDSELDGNSIKVQIGGKVVEVCCAECAHRLKEAHASAAGRA
jgi:ribosome-binding protein aMBF1 (putative translation factor)